MSKRILLLFLLVLGLAFALRVYKVNTNPISLSWDEVSIGYNAYSILKTGRDEHGRFLPLDTFIGFGDYKPPLAIYLTVPFVAVFGVSELAVRLPSVLFGTATVALTFLLTLALLKQRKGYESVGLVAAFILAVSPWHINLSRGGFEANIGLFFTTLGVYLVWCAQYRPKLLIISGLPFIAAMYTFNSARYVAPLIVGGLLIRFFPFIRQHIKLAGLGIVLSVIVLAPLVPHLMSPESRLRYKEVNIFSEIGVIETSNERADIHGDTWWSTLLHNRRIGFANSFFHHYFDHFTPQYLFIRGDGNPKFSTQDVGQFYMLDALFIVVGLFALYRLFPGQALFLSYWLLVAILPAAVARETPHALRTINSLPVWHIVIAFGIVVLWNKVRSLGVKGFFVFIYVFFIAYYLHGYYVHYPREYAREWQYGYKQALEAADTLVAQGETVAVSEYIGRAYMYILFYKQIDPEWYLANKQSYFDADGFYHVEGFGTYSIIETTQTEFKDNTLYIVPPQLSEEGMRVEQTISLPGGEPILQLVRKG